MRTTKPLYKFTPASASNVSARIINKANTTDLNMGYLNTGCSDTSSRFFISYDSAGMYVKDYIHTHDGNLLLSGEYVVSTGTGLISKGFLLKCDEQGTVYWTKLYDSLGHIKYSYFNYYKVLELNDGSILLAGSTPNDITGNIDVIFTKTDNSGNLLWSKVYKSRLWTRGSGSADYFYVQQLVQDSETGDIFFTGPHWTAGRSVTRLDADNGDIIWSNLYQQFGEYSDDVCGLAIEGKELRVFGKFPTNLHSYYSIYKLNKMTGDTIQSKFFQIDSGSDIQNGIFAFDPLVRLNNGNYILPGIQYGYYRIPPDTTALHQAGMIQFDNDLNFVDAYSFRNNTESNSSNTRLSVFPDGSGLFTMLDYISGYTSNVYYVQFKNHNILKQRIRHYSNEGIPNEGNSLPLKDGGSLTIKLLGDSTANNFSKIEFLKLHVTDSSSQCLGMDDHSTFLTSFSLSEVAGYIDSIGTHDFQENPNKTITTESATVGYLPGCEQISFCDTLSLSVPAKKICVNDPLLLTVHKNAECRAPVFFNFDSSQLQTLNQVNDSIYSIKFAAAWQGVIYVSTYGCNLLSDSLEITVLNSATLDLGPDTVLCPGNAIALHAGINQASYLWQDGSSDSVFIVKTPGTYFVKTTNACGGTFEDTVVVSDHPVIPFDAGPDLVKCNEDSLILSAPAGFISYAWSPPYHISSDTSRNVTVNPPVTTSYKIRGEISPGCFAYDSIKVTVHTSPVIDLGMDRELCSGDSLLLDAGSGFLQYEWNTGSHSREIIVREEGEYSIMAINAEGCQSSDTFRLTSVFSTPVVNLNKDSSLCTGSVREFDAGDFISYEWNTGEKTRKIHVSTTGTYSVKVTDINTCVGTDTAVIATLLPLPGNFLPADTSICSYSSIQLQANTNFSRYLWNTGLTTEKITVTQPGTYWLEVYDHNNCTGRDSIILQAKDCMAGFYIPNSFTPNSDGVNDVFKPLLFGVVLKFEFTIYNRFGEIVFRTNKVGEGWTGNYKNTRQYPGIFVWTCKYQLRDEDEKIEKGIVTLLK